MSGDTHMRTTKVRHTQSELMKHGVARRAAIPAIGLAAALLLGACTISVAPDARGRGIPTPRAPAVIGARAGASPTIPAPIPAPPTATAAPAPPPTAVPPPPTVPAIPTIPPVPAPAQTPIVVEGGVIVAPAPEIPPPPHPPAPPGACGRRVIHVVRAHETLYSIAVHYRTTAAEIMRLNRIHDPRSVAVGRRLVLVECGSGAPRPAPGARRYVVRAGDNLFRIGLRFGVSVAALRAANGLRSNDIRAGQVLVIP